MTPWGLSAAQLSERVGDLRQLASVRRVVLDDGAERGGAALVFSTGGGLDFWVLADRSMDIGPLWFRGCQLGWMHPTGFTHPAHHHAGSDGGTGFGRILSGFLVTCGLDNPRQPAEGLPLHGTLPLTPARITAAGEDWESETPLLFAEGTVTVAHLARPSFRLTRRIEAPIGGTGLRILDRIRNIGPDPADMRILYHTNFGFPIVDQDSTLMCNGQPEPIPSGVLCKDMSREDAVSLTLAGGRTAATLTTSGGSLPYLQLWSDPGPRRNILSVEPANCPRRPDGTSGPGTVLAPGACWSARQDWDFATNG